MIERRSVPKAKRVRRDPFQPGLPVEEIAARLEGRKVVRTVYRDADEFQSMYRVDLFRQWLPRRGMAGILQFYGVRARRSREVGGKWSGWSVETAPRLHTVDLGPNVKIK